MTSFSELLGSYGYAALIAGTFLEGETVLVAAGFLASRGYMNLPLVMLFAFLGSMAGDQCFFGLGRWKGQPWLLKHPSWQKRRERADTLMHRYGRIVLLGFRFAYGLRTIIPFALGLSTIPFRRFAFYNMIGALIWAVTVASAGYLFGSTLQILMDNFANYEHWIFSGIGALGVAIWLIYTLRKRRGGL